MQKILIYSPKQGSRLEYAFNFVFNYFLGIEWETTTDLKDFANHKGVKLNYSEISIDNKIIQVIPDELLFDRGITNRSAPDKSDIFAFSFYHLTRYQEYLNPEKDEYNRVIGKNLVFKKPEVDLAIIAFGNQLKQKFPSLNLKKHKFEFINTLDIDHAFLYRNKGFISHLKGCVKSLFQLNFKSVFQRIFVLSCLKTDPYDTFAFLESLNKKYNLNTVLFWLIPNETKIDNGNKIYKKLYLNRFSNSLTWAKTGMHPSNKSNENIEQLFWEKRQLESIAGSSIKKSRQHYIRLELPITYQRLIQLGIKEDYSMGYADVTGFRAATAHSFFWYDLENEKETDLKIYPFVCMDASLKKYMKLELDQINFEINRLIHEVEKVGGIFIPIFHNSSFNKPVGWKAWKKIYVNMIERLHDEKHFNT